MWGGWHLLPGAVSGDHAIPLALRHKVVPDGFLGLVHIEERLGASAVVLGRLRTRAAGAPRGHRQLLAARDVLFWGGTAMAQHQRGCTLFSYGAATVVLCSGVIVRAGRG